MTELHPITPSLAAEYKAVRLRALKDSPLAFGSTWQRESQLTNEEWQARASRLVNGQAIGFMVLSGGEYSGLALCLIDEHDPLKGELISMWVAPNQRGNGIGRKLIEAISTWAAERGIKTLQLMVTSVNESAIEFYYRLGFAKTGRTEPYPNDPDIIEYEMTKTIGGN